MLLVGFIAIWRYALQLPPREVEERIALERPLPAGLRIVAGEGGLRLGDPILDGALRVECDDEDAVRDLLVDEHLRGALLALFCEHPGAEIIDDQIVLRGLMGRHLRGHRLLAGELTPYTDEQLADARVDALALAEALDARPATADTERAVDGEHEARIRRRLQRAAQKT